MRIKVDIDMLRKGDRVFLNDDESADAYWVKFVSDSSVTLDLLSMIFSKQINMKKNARRKKYVFVEVEND